jgi:hypothetical protein
VRTETTPKRSLMAWAFGSVVVPVSIGVAVDGASEALKFLSHAGRTRLIDAGNGIGSGTDAYVLLLGLAACVAILVFAGRTLEKYGDPRPWVRNTLIVISLVIVGALEPWGVLLSRDQILKSYDSVNIGDDFGAVKNRFYDNPLVELREKVEPKIPDSDHVYCDQNCWIRLTYDVPSFWGSGFVAFDFDSNQKVVYKQRVP